MTPRQTRTDRKPPLSKRGEIVQFPEELPVVRIDRCTDEDTLRKRRAWYDLKRRLRHGPPIERQ